MNRALVLLLGSLAGAVELLAVTIAIWSNQLSGVVAAVMFHVCAVALCVMAAHKNGTLRKIQFDAILCTALFVPVFGPALAWTFRRKSDAELSESRQMLEQIERDIEEETEDYERPLVGDELEAALAQEIDAVSYREVLVSGDIDQKRNALRRLTNLGQPEHLKMIKGFLEDDEPELRLCAYLEIDRVRKGYEERISACRARIKELEESPEGRGIDLCKARAEIAHVHFTYGSCGVLDGSMAEFQLERAIEISSVALAEYSGNARASTVKALAHIELEQLDEAEACLGTLPDVCLEHPAIPLIRARICFLRRDLDGARNEARLIQAQGRRLPGWLASILTEPLAEPPAAVAQRVPDTVEEILGESEDETEVSVDDIEPALVASDDEAAESCSLADLASELEAMDEVSLSGDGDEKPDDHESDDDEIELE